MSLGQRWREKFSKAFAQTKVQEKSEGYSKRFFSRNYLQLILWAIALLPNT
jgi:hypothetical protein